MPAHRVIHVFNGFDMCVWCNKSREHHERSPATPYCESAPKPVVDKWLAQQAKIEEGAQTMQRAIRNSGQWR